MSRDWFDVGRRLSHHGAFATQVRRVLAGYRPEPAPPLVPPPPADEAPLTVALLAPWDAEAVRERLNLQWRYGHRPTTPRAVDVESWPAGEEFPIMRRMVEAAMAAENRRDLALVAELVEMERTGVALPPSADPEVQRKREMFYRAIQRLLSFGIVDTPLEAAELLQRILWSAGKGPE